MAEKEYIERDAALKIIDKFSGYLDDDMIFRIKYAIRKHIPAADVAPVKQGHWVYTEYAIYGEYDFPRCSECGFEPKEEISPYCPNCGVKMDGVRE